MMRVASRGEAQQAHGGQLRSIWSEGMRRVRTPFLGRETSYTGAVSNSWYSME
jgi:hypothetical protein